MGILPNYHFPRIDLRKLVVPEEKYSGGKLVPHFISGWGLLQEDPPSLILMNVQPTILFNKVISHNKLIEGEAAILQEHKPIIKLF